jgi:hypothetical protein
MLTGAGKGDPAKRADVFSDGVLFNRSLQNGILSQMFIRAEAEDKITFRMNGKGIDNVIGINEVTNENGDSFQSQDAQLVTRSKVIPQVVKQDPEGRWVTAEGRYNFRNIDGSYAYYIEQSRDGGKTWESRFLKAQDNRLHNLSNFPSFYNSSNFFSFYNLSGLFEKAPLYSRRPFLCQPRTSRWS